MGNYNKDNDFCSFKSLSKNIVTELIDLVQVIDVYNPKNKELKNIDKKLKSIKVEYVDSFQLTELLSSISLDINNLQIDLLQEERDNLRKLSLILSNIDEHIKNNLKNNDKQKDSLSLLSEEITLDLKSFENMNITSNSTISGIKSDIALNTNKLKNRIADFILEQEDLVSEQEKCIKDQKTELEEMKEKMQKMEDSLKEMKRLSYLDSLTGIQNRKSYDEFSKEINTEWSKNNKKNFSIIILDIDRFKKINDEYGHSVGDEILKYFGKILGRVEALYKTTKSFRYGGEEFIIVTQDLKEEEVLSLARKIKNTVSKNTMVVNKKINVDATISIGISHFKNRNDTINKVFKMADKALYKSKEKRNSISIGSKNKIETL